LELGLEFVNYDKYHQDQVKMEANRRKFRAHYCIGAKAVAALIKDLPPQNPKEFKIYDLFMTLSFVKNYNCAEVHGGNWRVCTDKVKKSVKCYFQKIQLLKKKKIRVGKFKNETSFAFSVDGVHCRTKERRNNPTAKVYSHKFHGPGVAYEVGIAIYEDRVLWIKGPFVASTHDKTMFESEDGPPDMPKGKRGIGDSAYQSLNERMAVHRDGHSKEMTNFINRVRARHESFYNRLKTFGILSNFRGSWNKKEQHQMFFEGCAVLVQYDMENGHPLMET